MSSPRLEIATASRTAALFAVRRWHYSRCLPSCDLVKYGVWEDGRYIGCVIYGRGPTPNLSKPYGLKQTQVCELARIALDKHVAPVSRIVSITLRMLRRDCPLLRLVISYADPQRGHHGGIYQAMNWIYTGSRKTYAVRINGRVTHPRTVNGKGVAALRYKYGPTAERIYIPDKYRYLWPLDDEIRRRIEHMRQTPPKRLNLTATPALALNPSANVSG